MMRLLEKTRVRMHWKIETLDGAGEAFALAQKIDAQLEPWALSSWRWRILYLRAQIDSVIQEQGHVTPEARKALKVLLDELETIYHVEPMSRVGVVHPRIADDAPTPEATPQKGEGLP